MTHTPGSGDFVSSSVLSVSHRGHIGNFSAIISTRPVWQRGPVNQITLGSGPTIILSVPIDPCSSVAPGTQHFESSIKRGLAWSRSTLLHQRSGALAELLKRNFQRTKFLRAQFR